MKKKAAAVVVVSAVAVALALLFVFGFYKFLYSSHGYHNSTRVRIACITGVGACLSVMGPAR